MLTTESDTQRTIHVVLCEGATAAVGEIRAKALRAGHTVVNRDGTRAWRVREPILGSDFRPTVHADGERVQCQWTEITMSADGERTTRNLRRVWVGYDAAMGY